MKVLITGVAGFLGTHVAEYFTEQGWEVFGIDNLTDYELRRACFDVEASRKHNLDFLKKLNVHFEKTDCKTYIPFTKFDLIIHCAAQPAMTIAIEDPKYDGANNVMGTLNMLDIAATQRIPFINCSSVHVYGNDLNINLEEKETRFVRNPLEINERTPILKGDLTPLHVSKRATELYTQSFAEMYGIRTASFRLTGMYGERQFGGMDHGWVANFVIRTIKERPITVFDTTKQVRDILYAKDAARAFFMWYENGATGIFNIGGGYENAISLGECLTEINKQTEIPQNINIAPPRTGDLYYFVCNYRKAFQNFGWKPMVNPPEGIGFLIKWAKENEDIL
jgi:CDP-paratose 2-epimerase